MTALALATAGALRVVESFEQMTLPAAEPIALGAPVRIDTAGKFTNANGTTATEAAAYGIAVRAAVAGEAVTAIRAGVIDGVDVSALAYWAAVYLSDTDGTLDTAAGTVSTVIGRVAPGWGQALGVAADKFLLVRFPV